MCKLYIETADLDNAVTSYIGSELRVHAGVAIQKLQSKNLQDFAKAGVVASKFFSIEEHTYHALTAGIAIGLKLAESQLSLDLSDGDGGTVLDDFATAYDVA